MRVVHPRQWKERSVEQSIESFRASFKRMGVPECDARVTWDLEALSAQVRFVIPPGTYPTRVVEHVIRYDETKHPRRTVLDVLWTLARWIDERSRRVKKGETFSAVFEGQTRPHGGAK